MTNSTHTHAALTFLGHLDQSATATFNIETYIDVPKGEQKPRPDPLLGRYANLTVQQVEALLPKLQAQNEQGAGIFITRNQCAGQRSELNITRVRGVHADMDSFTKEQLFTLTATLAPSIVVESSPGRYQLYWQLLENETLEKAEAKAINQRLAEDHGADPAAVDVSRLLRLPGFMHMKYRDAGKTPIVTANYHGLSYTADEIRKAFPPLATRAAVNPLPLERSSAPPSPFEQSQINALAQCIASQHPELWAGDWAKSMTATGSKGYPSQSEADLALAGHIGRALQTAGIGNELRHKFVDAVFSMSELAKTSKWQNRTDYRDRTIRLAVSGLSPNLSPVALTSLQLESHGDVRNAMAFAKLARHQYLYISSRDKWLHWHEGKWLLCEQREHEAKAKEVCGHILAAAQAIFLQDQYRGKKLVTEAMAAHTLPRINAMLGLTVSEPDMATTENKLDGDPYQLGVQNGIVDLKTGRHLYNQPEFRITRYCNADYVEDATCPQWLKFLDDIFLSDTATIDCVQRLLGLTLLGLSNEEVLVICYGHGSNGKSVFSNVILTILGGYALTAPPSLLTARRKDDNGPRNDVAALAGSRYVSINEMQAGDRLDEQIVKMLAGREPVSARFLHQEFFEFLPSFTPWLRTNHKPIITGDDDGIWRRLALLPFDRKFSDEEKDPVLESKLLSERDGILLWMVNGAQLYLKDGICQSPKMLSLRATYRSESDLLGQFLADKTIANPQGRVIDSVLYQAYKVWCEDNGLKNVPTAKSFTLRLQERGHKKGKSGATRYYIGLEMPGLACGIAQGVVGRISTNSSISL